MYIYWFSSESCYRRRRRRRRRWQRRTSQYNHYGRHFVSDNWQVRNSRQLPRNKFVL